MQHIARYRKATLLFHVPRVSLRSRLDFCHVLSCARSDLNITTSWITMFCRVFLWLMKSSSESDALQQLICITPLLRDYDGHAWSQLRTNISASGNTVKSTVSGRVGFGFVSLIRSYYVGTCWMIISARCLVRARALNVWFFQSKSRPQSGTKKQSNIATAMNTAELAAIEHFTVILPRSINDESLVAWG